MTQTLSIVIPLLNESRHIQRTLQPLQCLRAQGCDIIAVDGGSSDNTKELAAPLVDLVVHSAKGRARQMNAGAEHAQGSLLLFLHADTLLPNNTLALLRDRLQAPTVWGRFDVRLSGPHPMLRIIAMMMNWRSRITGIATGDQALFVKRDAFISVGGFPDIRLMEDIVLSQRLKSISRPLCLNEQVVTSSRRWEQHGILATVAQMWWLRLRFFLGTAPDVLAAAYRRGPSFFH